MGTPCASVYLRTEHGTTGPCRGEKLPTNGRRAHWPTAVVTGVCERETLKLLVLTIVEQKSAADTYNCTLVDPPTFIILYPLLYSC